MTIHESDIEEAFSIHLSEIPPYFYGDWTGIRKYELMYEEFKQDWLEERLK